MIPFAGTVYRMVLAGQDATQPVSSPLGRFHHDGQPAIYTSCSAEGCAVAIKRYLRNDPRPREIVPLNVTLSRVADLRQTKAASIIWQDLHAQGTRPPTWDLSDQARDAGAQAMLYASRSRPDLTHLVLFAPDKNLIRQAGPAQPFAQ